MKWWLTILLSVIVGVVVGGVLRYYFPVDIPYCDNLCELGRMLK